MRECGPEIPSLSAEHDGHPEYAYWNRTIGVLLQTLGTQAAGLSTAQAIARLRRFGPNVVREQERLTSLALLGRQLGSPLVMILVFAAVVSLVLRDWLDATQILIIVFCSGVLGFMQERRASKVIERLSGRLALTSHVYRDGELARVKSETLVPGDIVTLAAGDLIPADGILIDAHDFLVVESSLTGEALPVEKRVGVVSPDASLAQRTNCVFLGSSVRSGTARVLLLRTGRQTVYGGIADRLARRPPDSEFTRGVRQFGYTLLRIMIVMVLFVLLTNLLFERPAIDSLLFAVALAVGLSPELLPAIVSVTLSSGARVMARRGVVVRHLEAIENLGSMDVLCTDKTGTLTEGVIALKECADAHGTPSSEVQRLAYLNAALETGIENPLDAALVKAGQAADTRIEEWIKLDEIPYDFQRRRLTIVASDDCDHGTATIIVKGAFESVLSVCTHVAYDGREEVMDEALRRHLADYYQKKGTEGYRVLAIATKPVERRARYEIGDETDLCFVGFLIFFDRPKASARALIDDLAVLGVRLKIISGDNRYVTAHLADAVGLNRQAMLTGDELGALNDEALWQRAKHVDIFAEVDPHQKERIVRALQRTGHAVGYMGDGINDAPALHSADVGISVESAVDVARESADVILLGPDLDVLRACIEDGRRAFANTMKYICVTTSANFGNMVSMALGTLFIPFLPLLPKQILLNNLLSDLPSMAIAGDTVDAEIVERPGRWNVGDVRTFMVVFGLLSTVFDLLTFAALLYGFKVDEEHFRTAWFVLSLMTELVALLTLRSWRPAWRSVPRPLLLWGTVAIACVACALPYLGAVGVAFGFVPLQPPLFLILAVIILAYAAVTEIVKKWLLSAAVLRINQPTQRATNPRR